MENLSKEFILKRAKEVNTRPKINGIYFLINYSNIVYIGKGNDVHRRIELHRENTLMKFNKYHIIHTNLPRLKLCRLEQEYIKQFRPAFNKLSNPDYHSGKYPLWFKYISQEGNIKTIMDISKELGIGYQVVANIVKGKRKLEDGYFRRVSQFMQEMEGRDRVA